VSISASALVVERGSIESLFSAACLTLDQVVKSLRCPHLPALGLKEVASYKSFSVAVPLEVRE